ncbi:AAA family ATPase [Nesterenkonia lacusekhoensis]|uniref:AAA family ATPase n=1 Tax=Nesterenkonia lacusekhoensis TaxID=150832 RepID=UPI003CC9A62A
MAGRFPHELSAGQLQLFAVGLTLSRPGGLLLLDEPERHLDEERVEAVISVLEERASAGALVVAATHRAEIIERSARQLDLGPVGSR